MHDRSKLDVAVVGAGAGGLAACISLSRSGFDVVCLEPEPFPHERVGESLDWSAPRLLSELGVARDSLVSDEMATYKRGIRLESLHSGYRYMGPDEWLSRWPLRLEVLTLHVDRRRLDRKLFEEAEHLGVQFVWDRVDGLERDGDRVIACRTRRGQKIEAPWFVDASGRARVFGRAFGIGKVEYGRAKVSLWTRVHDLPGDERTALFGDETAAYMPWVWSIPIGQRTTSVGCVVLADDLKRWRRAGRSVEEIFRDCLRPFSAFESVVHGGEELAISVCSYRSYVSERVAGENWLMVGECASFPDPLTSSGFSAALRHAREATQVIEGLASDRAGGPALRDRYARNVVAMGHAFNRAVESTLYGAWVRRGLSPWVAARAYSIFGYCANATYQALSSTGPVSRPVLVVVLLLWRGWIYGWSLAGRTALGVRGFLGIPSADS